MTARYLLNKINSSRAIELGLAEADWYTSPVAREKLRELLERRDGPAIRDTVLWFSLIAISGWIGWRLWGSWGAVPAFMIYGVLYASTSDSRWHEACHGTAFKTDWMNNALYEIASFMVMRESVCWRWSHTRHHSDTIIVGRDPEIVIKRPPSWWKIIGGFFALEVIPAYFKRVILHSFGKMDAEEKSYIPESEFPKVFWHARIYLLIYIAVVFLSITTASILPLMFIGLPTLYGSWLMPIYGLTQHAGLAEDVLDHRLNCRTVYMNPLNRYLYWNMNYHTEHHMFPLVPYHALPRLHEAVKSDMPAAYTGIVHAFREIIPAIRQQMRDPEWFVRRELPQAKPSAEVSEKRIIFTDDQGWICAGNINFLREEKLSRIDFGRNTYVVVNTDNKWYVLDGMCTHGNFHLAEGLVKDGQIECPKHNGRFQLVDGAPKRAPVCEALGTYPVELRGNEIWFNPGNPLNSEKRVYPDINLRVVSNHNVATFIKELVLEPIGAPLNFTPGDYLQFDIPIFDNLSFNDFAIDENFEKDWEGLRHLQVFNVVSGRRNNYSIATKPGEGSTLRFNVRIALPPSGATNIPPGVGSSWMYALQPGDSINAKGPFGDFHVKPTQREMVYIGGGAGMAPIRAHIGSLFLAEESTARRVSFWYGARSERELFYHEEFLRLAENYKNFSYTAALSGPPIGSDWNGELGFIHEVAYRNYLARHKNVKAVEFYLCGPPLMISSCVNMLEDLGVSPQQISFDEF